ncbi:hypothetical protein [Burkholderia sp. LMG 13014]|uniref:hypothetical protein n=1 Tax=Burkholderia sp. LMG 13014 TaxID=2709306 RepID=UPI001965A1FD|nr:hypothetical protein [Burkholderia sp. LMG 13014]
MSWLNHAALNQVIAYAPLCVAIAALLVLLWRRVKAISVRRQVARVLDDRIGRYAMQKNAIYTGKNPSKVQ